MAIGIFATDLEESKKTSIAGRYLRDFKPELNCRYRVFLPQFTMNKPEGKVERVATLTIAARQFSYKQMGVFSYVYDNDELEIHDDQSFDDLTDLRNIERIARVLHASQHAAEIEESRSRAEKEAAEAGIDIDQTALGNARALIDEKYFGNKEKHKSATEKPLIGVAQKYTYTIGVFVPMTAAGIPEWEKATTAIWQLSVTKQDNILALYKAEAYQYSGKPYIEFSYDYKGADKAEAGRNAKYEFITPNLSLEAKYPEEWKTYGEQLMSTLPSGTVQEMAEQIIAKTGALHNRNSVADIVSKFYACVGKMQTAVVALKKLDMDYLKKNKKYIQMIPTLSKYTAIKDFIDSIEATEEDEDEKPVTTTATQTQQSVSTPQATPEPEPEYSVPVQSEDATVKGAITFGGLTPNVTGNIDDDEDAGLFGDT